MGSSAEHRPGVPGGQRAQLRLYAYGSLMRGEPVHERLFGSGDVIGVLPAALPGWRLWVLDESAGRYAGYPVATADDRPGQRIVGQLLVIRPDRHSQVLHRLQAYQSEGHDPLGADAPYVERHLKVQVLLGRPDGRLVTARLWLPGRPLLEAVARGHLLPVAGNDWRHRPESTCGPALPHTYVPLGMAADAESCPIVSGSRLGPASP